MPANRVMYIEQKSSNGSSLGDRGPAEIGEVSFSKTGTTIYFKGKSFRKSSACGYRTIWPGCNYVCVETGDRYWISGAKKRGTNRHWAGGGPVAISSTGETGRTAVAKERQKDQLFDQIRSGLEAAARLRAGHCQQAARLAERRLNENGRPQAPARVQSDATTTSDPQRW